MTPTQGNASAARPLTIASLVGALANFACLLAPPTLSGGSGSCCFFLGGTAMTLSGLL